MPPTQGTAGWSAVYVRPSRSGTDCALSPSCRDKEHGHFTSAPCPAILEADNTSGHHSPTVRVRLRHCQVTSIPFPCTELRVPLSYAVRQFLPTLATAYLLRPKSLGPPFGALLAVDIHPSGKPVPSGPRPSTSVCLGRSEARPHCSRRFGPTTRLVDLPDISGSDCRHSIHQALAYGVRHSKECIRVPAHSPLSPVGAVAVSFFLVQSGIIFAEKFISS